MTGRAHESEDGQNINFGVHCPATRSATDNQNQSLETFEIEGTKNLKIQQAKEVLDTEYSATHPQWKILFSNSIMQTGEKFVDL